MSEVTLVIEYEDGQEPSFYAGQEIAGGKLVGLAFYDALNEQETDEEEKCAE